jgi:nucleotide-binding universal stress UspA family protein
MTTVIAAIDNSMAARPVLATAGAVARFFDATPEAVHVRQNGWETARGAAEEAAVPVRLLEGPTVPALVDAARRADVEAVVVGARNTPAGGRPAGRTALQVIELLGKPVVVVPPLCETRPRLRRVLLPLEGTAQTSLAPTGVLELARDADVDIDVLHVHDEASLPLFTDQPQHETEAWTEEFVARYCPYGLRSVTVQLRIGRPEDEILSVMGETDVDLLALGWNQSLLPGRGTVVRAVLARASAPVLLIPVAASTRALAKSRR